MVPPRCNHQPGGKATMPSTTIKVGGDNNRGIYQRGHLPDGKPSYAFWIKPKGDDGVWRQEWHSYATPEKARDAREALRVAQREGRHQARRSITVEQFLDEWLDGLVDIRESTRHGYRKNVTSYIVPALGDVAAARPNGHAAQQVLPAAVFDGRAGRRAAVAADGAVLPRRVRRA